MATRVVLTGEHTREGELFAAGAVLSLPDLEAESLIAAGIANDLEIADRATRVVDSPQKAAMIGRPGAIRVIQRG